MFLTHRRVDLKWVHNQQAQTWGGYGPVSLRDTSFLRPKSADDGAHGGSVTVGWPEQRKQMIVGGAASLTAGG